MECQPPVKFIAWISREKIDPKIRKWRFERVLNVRNGRKADSASFLIKRLLNIS